MTSRPASQVPSQVPGRVKVAVVVTRFIAGAGGVALHGALQLDPDRYDVTILSGLGGPLVDEAEAAGVRYEPLRWMHHELSPSRDLRGVRELTGRLKAGSFDLVHTHSGKAGMIGRIAARRAGVRGVLHTLHGLPFHEFQSAARRRAYILAEQRLGRLTDRFLAVGASVAADAIRLGITPPEKVMVINSTVNQPVPPRTRLAQRAAREALGAPPGTRVVGAVGRLDYQKAPGVLVEALARLNRPDVYAVWVGDGPLRAEVEALARHHRLESRLRFLGNRVDVPALLPGFDLFVLPSRYEGLPCAIAEAMTCGVPVVAAAVNSVPEMVVPGRTGLLIPPADPDALAAAVGHLLDHPAEAARLAAAATVHIGDGFTPAALGRDVRAAYEHVLSGRHRGADARPRPLTRRPGPVVPASPPLGRAASSGA